MKSSGIALPRAPGVSPWPLSLISAGLVACLIASAALAAPALGAVRSGPTAELSPRLATLAQPSVRRSAPAVQAERLSVAEEGPGSLLREGGRVIVEARFASGASDRVEAVRRTGARVEHVSDRYETVTVAARPDELKALAQVAGVESVREVLAPILSATECHGLVTSEGDAQLAAAAARSGFGVDGSGVTVGILSDSFDTDPAALTRASQDVASGDLPGGGNPCGRTASVLRLNDLLSPGNTIDEGRAMAQIVHDLAPGAAIQFATAFVNEISFADNIRALAASGSDIIVDDVTYLDEPFFQEGPVGVAAGDVRAAGVGYYSSAGNNNMTDAEGNQIASWEAPEFRDTDCPAELEAVIEAESCMDFDPVDEGLGDEDPTFGILVPAGETLTIDLQWAEPRFGVNADLDVFLLEEDDDPIPGDCLTDPDLIGLPVVGGCENNVAGAEGSSERPVEVFSWENESAEPVEVQLAINRCFSTEEEKEEEAETEEPKGCNPFADPEAKPRIKFAILQNGGGVTATEYPESGGGDVVGPTIFGHNGSANAISTAAVPFFDGSTPEEFSSRGPVTHHFGPVLGTTPAPPLSSPQVLAKPDLAATDGGLTTFFGSETVPGEHRFFGTSAAAPHAAAVAALMRQANPGLTPGQVQTALAASARPVGTAGVDAVGAGLVDAFGAVSRVALPPRVQIDSGPKARGNNTRPAITFSANRPVTFACTLDGGVPFPCASPFNPAAPLPDGGHSFFVTGMDAAGRRGSSQIIAFEIDSTPPRTFIRAKPRKVIRTGRRRVRARFRFRSNDAGATFECKVDRKQFRRCRPRYVRRYGIGRHVVRVRAVDDVGNVDPTPAAYRFRVRARGAGKSRRDSAERHIRLG